MFVRDAREADAEALARIADAPVDVMRNLVHDRSVRVAEAEAPVAGTADGEPAADDEPVSDGERAADVPSDRAGASDPEDLLGFVSFDAREDTVYVTQLDGTADACERLLDEPVRFAERESMAVEALVPSNREPVAEALESVGFRRRGRGPRFDGTPTARFRLEP